MLSFLFFILIVALIVVLIVVSTVWRFILSIFGIKRQTNPFQNTNSAEQEQPTPKSKIFDKAEGEYVDFEEIKD